MKVNWKTHPNNIGHFYFPGCFRCHDGNHVSKDGKVIKQDRPCNLLPHCRCWDRKKAVRPDSRHCPRNRSSHPVDIGDLSGVTCSDCHNGGVGP